MLIKFLDVDAYLPRSITCFILYSAMSVSHENFPQRVPRILGSFDTEAQLFWHDVSLTLDEIRDVEAAKTRFLIVYGKILVLLEMQHQTD